MRDPFGNLPSSRRPFAGLPPTAVRSFTIKAPVSTHFRPATCAEIECPAWAHGWVTYIDEGDGQGRQQAQYIRARSERAFTERREPDGRTAFVFKPGQRCFRSGDHRVPLEREPLFVARVGDWRGTIGDPYQHKGRDPGGDWVNQYMEHIDRLVTQ